MPTLRRIGALPVVRPTLAAAAVCAALLTAVTTLAAGLSGYLASPLADHVDWVARLMEAEADGRWLAYVWEPHALQRIPIVRMIEAADLKIFDGRVPTFLVAGALSQLLGLAGVWIVLSRSRLAAGHAFALGAAATLAMFQGAVAEDLAWPFFSVYPLVAGTAAASIAAFVLAGDSPRPFALAAALGFAALCSGGNAAGLAIWPTLLVAGLRERRPWRSTAAVLLVGLAVSAAMEAGLPAPSNHLSSASLAPEHLIKMAAYLGGFAALPWGGGDAVPFWQGIGLALVLTGAWTLLKPPRGGVEGRVERLGDAMILFGLLTACLAAVGRVDELPRPVVPTRYTPLAALLHLGLVLSWSRRMLRWAPRLALATYAMAAAAVLGVGLAQWRAVRISLANSRVLHEAAQAFDRGDRSPAVVGFVHPDPDRAAAVRARLAARVAGPD